MSEFFRGAGKYGQDVSDIKVFSTHGNAPIEMSKLDYEVLVPQEKILKGSTVLVATPDRLLSMMAEKNFISFSNVEWLVIDDASTLLDTNNAEYTRYLNVILVYIERQTNCQLVIVASETNGVLRKALGERKGLVDILQKKSPNVMLPFPYRQKQLQNIKFKFKQVSFLLGERFEVTVKEMVMAFERGLGHVVISCRTESRCSAVSKFPPAPFLANGCI